MIERRKCDALPRATLSSLPTKVRPSQHQIRSGGVGRSSGILVTMFNKTFYRFLFGFLAVLASTLVIILIAGAQSA